MLAGLVDAARRLLGVETREVVVGSSDRRTVASDVADRAVSMGAFRMVGLTEVRAKLGDRWPELSAKVHLIAENTISRHLIRGDVFERQGEDAYLVLFATLGPAEAEFKSRVIAKQINEHLLGIAGDEAIGVAAHCAQVSALALAEGDADAALADALASAAPLDPATLDATPPSHGREPAPGLAPAGGGAVAEPERSVSPPGPHAGQPPVRTWGYSPVWDVSQMTLLRYRAFPLQTEAGASGRAQTDSVFLADAALIRVVGDHLRALAEQGRRLPVIVPVRHESLSSSSRRAELQRTLAAAPAEARKLMTVELCFPRDEFAAYACRTFVEMAHAQGVGWSALIDLERLQLMAHDLSGARSVGVDVSGDEHTETESLRLLTSFAAKARASAIDCAAYGLTSRPLVLGAMAAGFRFLSGPAIHADEASLSNAVRFQPLDLYADLIKRSSGGGEV